MKTDLNVSMFKLGGPSSGPRDVDWLPLITIAERRRDSQGRLLPLQSYAQTVERGMEFILQGNSSWFKGPVESLLDEQGRSMPPWVYYSNLQHDGSPFPDAIDRFVSYPAFHHSLAIRVFVYWWRHTGDTAALQQAIVLANWNIANSTPPDWAYGSLPYSTLENKKPGGFRDKSGLMPDKAAIMGLAYLELFIATQNTAYRTAATEIARTLQRRQRGDGTWFFRVDPRTEEVIEDYSSSVIYAIRLFETLDQLHGTHEFHSSRNRAWDWLVTGPITNLDWRGFYEDILDSKTNRTNHDCIDTIRYLLKHRSPDNGYLEMAQELNAWIERTFVDIIPAFAPAEGVREQLVCNIVMGVHSLNWASMLLQMSKATGDKHLAERARQTANYVTYYLQPDGRIVTGFGFNAFWYSCHFGVVLYMLDFIADCSTTAN